MTTEFCGKDEAGPGESLSQEDSFTRESRVRQDLPDRRIIQREYERYAEARTHITRELLESIEAAVCDLPSPPTVKGRPKDFSSFFKKYIRLLKKAGFGTEKPQVTDLIGIRVICPFLEDLTMVEAILSKTFEVIEVERKGSNYSFKEFGYESTHLLIKIPDLLIRKYGDPGSGVAEVQIRTILQDAWAEVEHELVYKAEFTPFDEPIKRKLAAVNANLSLADLIFQEIRTYQRQLNGEMGKRRDSFFRKIEEAADAFLAEDENDEAVSLPLQIEPAVPAKDNSSMDDFLLNALYAHNKNQFSQAIYFYSRILTMNPDNSVRSLVYKHRGMANFAQSRYEDAIMDFSESLKLDPGSYKAAYYRGVVHSVLREHSEAIDDFTLSLEINPYQNFCLYRRGQAYYHLGDYPQALGDCESALVLDNKFRPARQLRNLLLKKLKM
jgi:putative GTP pyrophosphokinase